MKNADDSAFFYAIVRYEAADTKAVFAQMYKVLVLSYISPERRLVRKYNQYKI